MSASAHHMDFTIYEDSKEWRVTGFYGWAAVNERHLLWELLRVLSRQSSLPWICVGDFNEVLYSTEMKGGSRPQWQMNNFQAVVDDCGLRDETWEGYMFTFDNGQVGDDNRQSMLDRAMGTSAWIDMFPYAKLFYLEREWSDHAPIRLVLDRRVVGGLRKHRFRFEQIWVGEEGCEEAVIRGVEKGNDNLGRTISEWVKEIQAWKKSNIGKINWALERKRKQLERLNNGTRTEAEVQRRKKLVAEIAELNRQEEQYWRQRSHALWLRDGDHNTTFFNTRAGECKRKNYIGMLIDDNGTERVGDEAVATVAVNYFRDLFATSEPSNLAGVLSGLEGRVSEQMNSLLREEYREEEIVEAISQMHPLKSPGLDGMNGLFYQSYWHVIGPDVISSVLRILRGESSPAEFNKTNIVLIPKKNLRIKCEISAPLVSAMWCIN
ncbi:uncharacterized protein LOC141601726 [Silene latifolia]|uniref:uncharacterized protein LOC141601726 n=1 Tax=Silene latifolia TaxID=37657 RepID=UPI003D7709FA